MFQKHNMQVESTSKQQDEPCNFDHSVNHRNSIINEKGKDSWHVSNFLLYSDSFIPVLIKVR